MGAMASHENIYIYIEYLDCYPVTPLKTAKKHSQLSTRLNHEIKFCSQFDVNVLALLSSMSIMYLVFSFDTLIYIYVYMSNIVNIS